MMHSNRLLSQRMLFIQFCSTGYRKEVVRLLISHLDRKKLMSVLFAFEYESTTKRDDTKPFEFSKEKPNERAMKFRLSQRKSNPPMLAELMKTAAEKEQEVAIYIFYFPTNIFNGGGKSSSVLRFFFQILPKLHFVLHSPLTQFLQG